MKAPKHEHLWRPQTHLDYCHEYEWRYECECGAVRHERQDRDLEADPWSVVWMLDDDGTPSCDRCREILDGADLERHEFVADAQGNILINHVETCPHG